MPFNPGPRYRETAYGWEPASAWKEPVPPAPASNLTVLSLVRETVACGVPPRRAVKWWGYVLAALRNPAGPER